MSLQGISLDFLAGGGEMGALLRAYDWNASTLGPTERWPQSLRVTIRLMLNTRHPMFIWWGSDLIQFYNDAYKETMGPERHPSALGDRGRECWAEIWDIIGPQIELVMAGKGSTWNEDRLVPVTRNGRREDVWWTYSYSPIDLEGGVGGVLVVCNDVTPAHLATEALQGQARRLEQLFEQAPSFIAVLRGPDHLFEFTNAAYRRLVGDRQLVGKAARVAIPEAAGQGFFELLDDVYRTGKAHLGRRMPLSVQLQAGGPVKEAFLDFIYQPIIEGDGSVSGIFVEGVDVTDHVRNEEHLRLINDELKHRVKNTLAVVSAIASQTLRGTARDAPLRAFQGRLAALGNAHDLLTPTTWASAWIDEVVKGALVPHRSGENRIAISGPRLVLASRHAISLALAVHELATNALKYGALSDETGRVSVSWSEERGQETQLFCFEWRESDGPIVSKPARQGFGSQLIQRVLAGDFGGEVELLFEPTGMRCRLTAPMANISQALPGALTGLGI